MGSSDQSRLKRTEARPSSHPMVREMVSLYERGVQHVAAQHHSPTWNEEEEGHGPQVASPPRMQHIQRTLLLNLVA